MAQLSLRTRLYIAQAGVCCYCEKPMLLTDDMTVKRFAKLYGLTTVTARQRIASLEHLVRSADGGTNARNNLALACVFCNSKRQDKSWVLFKSERMQNRIPAELRAAA